MYTPGFVQFWQHYPVKKKKQEAWKAWHKDGLESLGAEICHSIAAHQDRDADWRQGFIPHASTYLHGRRWEDEFPDADAVSPASRRKNEHEGHHISNYPSGKYCQTCKREVLAREWVS